jgi:hypothetical protein
MIPTHAIMIFLLLLFPQVASAQINDLLKGFDKLTLPGTQTLENDKIISGLKEALRI